MSELRNAVQRLCFEKIDEYAAGYSYCTSCHEISDKTPFPHAANCPVNTVDAALAAHEKEHAVLVHERNVYKEALIADHGNKAYFYREMAGTWRDLLKKRLAGNSLERQAKAYEAVADLLEAATHG